MPQTFEMELVFLNATEGNEFEFVQKRAIHKACAYHHIQRKKNDDEKMRLEYSTDITPKEYLTFVDSRN